MFKQVEDLVDETDLPGVLKFTADSRIYEEDLYELYSYMTENRGSKRGLTKVMREHDFEKVPTTLNGLKVWYYHIPLLSHYRPTLFLDETEDGTDVDL